MTEIISGKLEYNEVTKNSNGGTEQMARRMVRDIDPELLKNFQIIHSRPRELKEGLKKILVCHDLAHDPEVNQLSDPDFRNQFDKIVFVSNWQMEKYNLILGVPYGKSVVIRNGIEPFQFKRELDKEAPVRLIYHTTPHRGLNILLAAYSFLIANQPDWNVTLDVFSSFKAYGWGHRDEEYQSLFDSIPTLKGATYHGYQPNEVVREALTKSDIFAYPSIWPETSCIAAMEAMCAGVLPVTPNLAALPETVGECDLFSYQWNENNEEHFKVFYQALGNAIYGFINDREGAYAAQVGVQNVASKRFDWNLRKREWEGLLKSLL